MRRLIAAAALIVPSFTAVAAVSSPAGATTTTTTTITTTGETPYVVPANVVSLHVTVIGVAGDSVSGTGLGAAGAKLEATIAQPTAGTTLYAEVGAVSGGGGSDFAYNGGGASSLQTCSTSDVSCTYTGDSSTDPRLLVAGGGGGDGETYPDTGGLGGVAGALSSMGAGTGGAGTAVGAGGGGGVSGLGGTAGVAGTQSSDCIGSSPDGTGSPGTAGLGGNGGNANSGHSGSGGGGGNGWFGGGGGGAGNCAGDGSGTGAGGGGGAGSSYAVASATGVTLTTATDPATVVIVATIGTAPVITSTNHASFSIGTKGSFTVTSTCDPAAMLSESGALPSGVTFTDNGNGTATLVGTPAAGTAGTSPLTITASGCAAPNATQSFSLVVSNVLAATGSSLLTEGMVGLGLLVLAGLLILADRRRRHLGA